MLKIIKKTKMFGKRIKLKYFYREYKKKEFNFLDVGCGNHSVKLIKLWFEFCHYYGLDNGVYNNNDSDFKMMEKFYDIDLNNNDLSAIPNNFFDIINIYHMIEHIQNGLDIIAGLSSKIKKGGKIYIEYPGVKSLSFPSVEGTLNFCDDPTHVRVYDVKEICNVLLKNSFRIISAGTRYDGLRILLGPLLGLRALLLVLFRKKNKAKGLWYILGFAEYVYAEKIGSQY